MDMVTELTVDQVYRACGPEDIGCDTSQELTALETIIGQDRAIRAMQFGLGIRKRALISLSRGILEQGVQLLYENTWKS
jgi:hypothetical protein